LQSPRISQSALVRTGIFGQFMVATLAILWLESQVAAAQPQLHSGIDD
jgi:hypothetical protein